MNCKAKKMAKNIGMVICLSALASAASAAGDVGLAGVANNLSENQFPALLKVINIGSYVAGFAFAFKAALKFKEQNESKGQIPISTPVVLAIVAGLLIALPTVLKTTLQTLFGSGGATESKTVNMGGNLGL